MRVVNPLANILRCLIPIRTFSVVEDYMEMLYDHIKYGDKSKYYLPLLIMIVSALYSFFRLPISFIFFRENRFVQILLGDYSLLVETKDQALYFFAYEIYNINQYSFLITFWFHPNPSWYVILQRIRTKLLPLKKIGPYSAHYFLIYTTIGVLNSFQMFTCAMLVWMSFVLNKVVEEIVFNWDLILSYWGIPMVIILFHYLNQALNCFGYLFHSQIMGGLIYYKLMALFIYHVQNMKLLYAARTEARILQVMNNCKTIIYFIFRGNEIYSRFFTFYIGVLFPFNAYGNMVLAFRSITLYHCMIFAASGHFIVAICFVHFAMAFVMKRIHTPGKMIYQKIIHWEENSLKKLTLTTRLRMAMFFEKYHTNKKYGIQYWNSGNISLGSFAKCCVIYSEVLMWSYKIVAEIR